MHPSCPDYDLCQNCEAFPIAVHPENHPLLKMKTPDAVVPNVHRVGQHNSVHAFGSITPTPFTGSRTHEVMSATTTSQETPMDMFRAATPTPASAGLMTSNQADWMKDFFLAIDPSKPSVSAANPSNATFGNPFADIFSVDPAVPVPPPMTPVSLDVESALNVVPLQHVIPDPTSSEPNTEPDNEGGQTRVSERLSSSEVQVPGALPGMVYSESSAVPSLSSQAVSVPSTDVVPEPVNTVVLDSGRQPDAQENDLEKNDTKSDVVPTASLLDSLACGLVRELPKLLPQPVSPSKGKGSMTLSAAFVEDVTVPDGQIFPPGAEFVKCWRLINDSGCDWPESTELVFLAGDSLSAAASVGIGMGVAVGKAGSGETIEVSTGELKAPEAPGRYFGYWRLKADGELFGNTLWVE